VLSVRAADPVDAMAVARVHVRSWQAAYRGLLPSDYLDQLRPEERASRYTFGQISGGGPETIVVVDDDAICGFATTGPAWGSDQSSRGELLALYVDPDWWRRGIGRRLVDEARRRLSADGFTEAILWVLVGNRRGELFYRADGWLPDGMRREGEVWGARVDEVRYGRALP
jgi:ribosomal protein S18 acetylase RimI-like enzyme